MTVKELINILKIVLDDYSIWIHSQEEGAEVFDYEIDYKNKIIWINT